MSAKDHGCESLASLLDDAAVELEMVATGSRPDFADVIARAQRLEPARAQVHAIRSDAIPQARRLNALGTDALEQVARIGDLELLLASARVELAGLDEAHARAGVPPLRADPPARRRFAASWAIALGLAAMLVAALSLGWRARVMNASPPHGYSGASKTADGDDWARARIDDTPRPAPTPVPRDRVLAPAPLEFVIAKDEPAPTLLPTTPPRKPAPSVTERIVALDRDARAAWKAGDLRAAEDGFAAIVQRGGRRSLVDLAYGDLFELARQRHDRAREAQLWQRYLQRFPNGRFADEARAGLCRRAVGAQARACWQRYLEERPHGTYRDHARAALGSGTAATTHGPR